MVAILAGQCEKSITDSTRKVDKINEGIFIDRRSLWKLELGGSQGQVIVEIGEVGFEGLVDELGIGFFWETLNEKYIIGGIVLRFGHRGIYLHVFVVLS